MPWVTLPEVKAHLGKKTPDDDDELDGFISAACAMVEDIIGHVDPVTVTGEVLRAAPVPTQRPYPEGGMLHTWDWVATLAENPVLSVESVLFTPGDGTSSAVAAQNVAAGVVVGWRRVGQVMYLPVGTSRYGAYSVTYTAGLDPVPGNVRMAALELAAHLWKTTQNATGAPGRFADSDTDWQRGMNYALPFRVRELLGLYGNTVPSRGVVIA